MGADEATSYGKKKNVGAAARSVQGENDGHPKRQRREAPSTSVPATAFFWALSELGQEKMVQNSWGVLEGCLNLTMGRVLSAPA